MLHEMERRWRSAVSECLPFADEDAPAKMAITGVDCHRLEWPACPAKGLMMERMHVLRTPWFQLVALTGIISAGITAYNATQSRRTTSSAVSSTPEPRTATTAASAPAGTPVGQTTKTAQASPDPSVPASTATASVSGPTLTTHSEPKNIVESYIDAANGGDADAQFQLGLIYFDGKAVKEDLLQAASWMRKAAEAGLPAAQFNIGLMYAHGAGVKQDHAEAAKWLRKAAEQGWRDAQTELGFAYTNGRGVDKNLTEAFHWFRAAAEQGNAVAQRVLAGLYFQGAGVKQDKKSAAKWATKAAEQGDLNAEFLLATLYLDGDGVPRDVDAGMKWLRKSAEDGDIGGRIQLGRLYLNGLAGVERDPAKAFGWFLKAAYQNDPDAEFIVGFMYENGAGVSKNMLEAERWYRKAADQNLKEAKEGLKRINPAMFASAANAHQDTGSTRSQTTESDLIREMVRAHIKSGSTGDIPTQMSLYADKVDFLDEGVKTREAIESDLPDYYAHWPIRHFNLESDISIEPLGQNERKVSFILNFDAKNPTTGASRDGAVDVVWILRRSNPSSEFKIVSHNQKSRNPR